MNSTPLFTMKTVSDESPCYHTASQGLNYNSPMDSISFSTLSLVQVKKKLIHFMNLKFISSLWLISSHIITSYSHFQRTNNWTSVEAMIDASRFPFDSRDFSPKAQFSDNEATFLPSLTMSTTPENRKKTQSP